MSKVTVQRVRRERVSAQVFQQLKARLIEGVWRAGEKLPSEGELSHLFGVSRVSVREALHRLATLGLLETRHGEGTFVCSASSDYYINNLLPALVLDRPGIYDVLEYRQTMEKGIVALVVEKATDTDIEVLENHYRKMLECKADSTEFAHADLDFHLALARATKNQVFFKVNSIIRDILCASMENIVGLLGPQDGLDFHKRILEAIKQRDSETAQALMEEHVRRTVLRLRDEKRFSDER
ncbi:FadR/GntR family transcriptional regulator [Marispirochaeta sp.]|jgi:GntR family transcriptional regulator, transcriptional repressor for pyruvate dehydrogenase complex|uniref:FadR/GntR family transcriptional regulator n=1 Tax=Marispirochaeta sp. TaxID=2038653 RepID=UPI0029C857C4|nr:FadR/GntR family transcriptional regulator [Marispirochaeta sp.]